MKVAPVRHAPIRPVAMALAVLAGCTALDRAAAQPPGPGHVTAAPQAGGPPMAVNSGLPNPAGLGSGTTPARSSPVAIGSGLQPTPAPASTGRYVHNPDADSTLSAPGTNVLGAGGADTAGMGAGPSRGPWSSVDIARSFILADTNRDGELTRAEAQRLTIAPYSFEEMDRNHDGILSRFEYEDATR